MYAGLAEHSSSRTEEPYPVSFSGSSPDRVGEKLASDRVCVSLVRSNPPGLSAPRGRQGDDEPSEFAARTMPRFFGKPIKRILRINRIGQRGGRSSPPYSRASARNGP